MTVPAVTRHAGRLSPAQVAEVAALAAAAGDADGTYPLSEPVTLRLRHGADRPVVHLLARDPDGNLAGYAQVVPDPQAGAGAEIVVHPAYRGRGIGRDLVTAAVAEAGSGDPAARLRLWAHGDHPAAAALARTLGFERYRVLWRLHRPLSGPVAVPDLPGGITIRAFRPGVDDRAWLAVNNRAFADHPDQGRWTLADLRVRMGEAWFDPAGFLLAEAAGPPWLDRVADRPDSEGGRLLGFHWTKIHTPVPGATPDRGSGTTPARQATGEVYVLGVDPVAQGAGLARVLTLAGLEHLRGRGLREVMLYVDESNPRAVRLYEKLGFRHRSTDVGYRHGPDRQIM